MSDSSDASVQFIDLFAGIGGIRLGLERAGGKCVFSSEWDHNASKTYAAYFGDKPRGDITKIQDAEVLTTTSWQAVFPAKHSQSSAR